MEDVSTEAYRRVMSVNVDGVFFGLRRLIPLMRIDSRNNKRIIGMDWCRIGSSEEYNE